MNWNVYLAFCVWNRSTRVHQYNISCSHWWLVPLVFDVWIVRSISNIKCIFRRTLDADFKPISLSLDVACSLSHLSYSQNTFPMIGGSCFFFFTNLKKEWNSSLSWQSHYTHPSGWNRRIPCCFENNSTCWLGFRLLCNSVTLGI